MFYFKKNAFIALFSFICLYLSLLTSAYGQDTMPMKLKKTSKDKKYGFTKENPIKVGTVHNEYVYLRALLDKKGEEFSMVRDGSCCSFETNSPRAIFGGGMLDVWIITYKKDNKKVTLYLNGYDFEEPKAPVGFKFSKEKKEK